MPKSQIPATAAGDDDPGSGPDDRGPGGGQPAPRDAGSGDRSAAPSQDTGPGTGPPDARPAEASAADAESGDQDGDPGQGRAAAPAALAAPGPTFRVRHLEVPGIGAGAAGRRSRARGETGLVTGARVPRGPARQLHLAGTVAAAAPHQVRRGRTGPGGLLLRPEDLREPRREGREGNLVLFVVDASGSMAARARMGAVKGAVLSLLLDAYQRRDKVGMITFRGSAAQLLLPPTSSVEAAAARLAALPTGGRTPLAAGLLRAHEVLRTERLRDPQRRPLLVLVTDGRATSRSTADRPRSAQPGTTQRPSGTSIHPSSSDPTNITSDRDPVAAAHRAAGLLAAEHITSVVVDCETGPARLGLAAGLARALDGMLLRLEELAAGPLTDTIRALKEVA